MEPREITRSTPGSRVQHSEGPFPRRQQLHRFRGTAAAFSPLRYRCQNRLTRAYCFRPPSRMTLMMDLYGERNQLHDPRQGEIENYWEAPPAASLNRVSTRLWFSSRAKLDLTDGVRQ